MNYIVFVLLLLLGTIVGAQAQEAADFQRQHAKVINELLTIDHYDQQKLDALDLLLRKDKDYCRKHQISGSALSNVQLDIFACRILSDNTTGQPTEPLIRLARTHEALIKPYLRIIFGEDYTSEQVAEIVKNNPQYLDDAEVFYNKARKEHENSSDK